MVCCLVSIEALSKPTLPYQELLCSKTLLKSRCFIKELLKPSSADEPPSCSMEELTSGRQSSQWFWPNSWQHGSCPSFGKQAKQVRVHYSDVIMDTMASQITGVSIVCSAICSGADQSHQNPASLAFVRGIIRRPVDSLHKGSVSNAENVFIWRRHHVPRSACVFVFNIISNLVDIYRDDNVNHSGETDEANCSWLHPVWPSPKRPDQDNTFVW